MTLNDCLTLALKLKIWEGVCIFIYIHTHRVRKLDNTVIEIFKRLISQASFKFQNKAILDFCSLTTHSHSGCFIITMNHYQDIVTTFSPYPSYPQLAVPAECGTDHALSWLSSYGP